ncbi:hypothetical protein WMQ00_11880, partial [Corynebacterium sp. KPL2825]
SCHSSHSGLSPYAGWKPTHKPSDTLQIFPSTQTEQNLGHFTLLFTYLQPPPTTIDPDNLAATTNSLEGGINAPIKELARRHRGLSLPHQRTVMDWWLYLHTEVPDDPVKIARDQRWGQDALSTATDLITHNTTATTNDIGAPAEYDTAIDTSYQHNLGIQKGWIK